MGIILGIGASLSQSLSYLFSRRFIKECGDDWRLLLAVSHILMGLMSLVILPFLCVRQDFPALKAAVIPAIGTAGFYFTAQAVLFAALKRVEASRISPLLGLKVVVLALLATAMGKQHLHWQNWLAVVMSGSAAFFLNEIGGRIPLKAMVFVTLTVTGYSFSDMNIRDMLIVLAPAGDRGPFIGVCMSYILCGVCGGLMLFKTGLPKRRAWVLAFPHAVAWFASMFLFYWSIVMINLIFASVVQATRGIISIWLGVIVAELGMDHIEKPLSRGVLWKRIAAAVLMVVAIVLYSVYRQ
ncbi:MAG: EamA family transporter [Kiritimatiellae bacterium]|nr:EamA family transporter [Kiritimatiellia bacterium]MDD5520709.1 EamA family transporter [Kiritimatiellia bacterium]